MYVGCCEYCIIIQCCPFLDATASLGHYLGETNQQKTDKVQQKTNLRPTEDQKRTAEDQQNTNNRKDQQKTDRIKKEESSKKTNG